MGLHATCCHRVATYAASRVECSMRLTDFARPSRARLGSRWKHQVGRCYCRYRGAIVVGIILESFWDTQNILGGTPKILIPRCYKGEWFWGSRQKHWKSVFLGMAPPRCTFFNMKSHPKESQVDSKITFRPPYYAWELARCSKCDFWNLGEIYDRYRWKLFSKQLF